MQHINSSNQLLGFHRRATFTTILLSASLYTNWYPNNNQWSLFRTHQSFKEHFEEPSYFNRQRVFLPEEVEVTPHCSVMMAEGKNLIRKLERDQIQITPRHWSTFSSVPNELLIAILCVVISAPLTVNERAVTSCAALFNWCNLYTCKEF